MLRTLVVAALLLTIPAVVQAHGACDHGAVPATALGPLYLTADDHVYQEANGHAGLQTAGGSCEDDNGRIQRWTADTLVI